MPKNINVTERDTVVAASLPFNNTSTVSHKFIIDKITEKLKSNLIELKDEFFKMNTDGKYATGVHMFNHKDNEDYGLAIMWVNTYSKTFKFKAVLALWNKKNNSFIITKDENLISRRGTIIDENKVSEIIDYLLLDRDDCFDINMKVVSTLKEVNLSILNYSELLGQLFIYHDLLSIGQFSSLKEKLQDHLTINLLDLYNLVSSEIISSHPSYWLTQQEGLIYPFLVNRFVPNEETIFEKTIELHNSIPNNEDTNLLSEKNMEEEFYKETSKEEDILKELITIDNFDDVIPLNEQIASEEILPVTEEEKEISPEPIINIEDEVNNEEKENTTEVDNPFLF